jgi:polysaccharide export outer membrane protein
MAGVSLSLFLLAAALEATPRSVRAQADAPDPAPTAATDAPSAPRNASAPEGYRIGPEDVLEIDVWSKPELSRKVPVRPDGRISLPLLNDVQASGLTPMQLRDVLLPRLAEYVTAPEVSVIVTEVRGFSVSVLGEVSKPGRFELKSQLRLVDALALAGGLTQFASRNLLVLRSNGHSIETHRFDYNRLRASDAGVIDFLLQPDDVLLVP